MKTKTIIAVLFVLCCVPLLCTGFRTEKRWNIFKSKDATDNIMDVSDFSIYYDVNTNETIRKMMPRPWYKPGWLLRLPFRGGKCSCEELKCTCCTGMRIQAFNFDRTTCAILKFNTTELMIDLEVKMNNDTVFRSSYNALNAPPFCVPIPVPYLPPGLVDMCIRLFDINIVDQRLHVCMDMDTRVDMAPVLVLHYDCMDMGFNGVSLSKPSGANLLPSSGNDMTTTTEQAQLDSDVYDPVTEKMPTSTELSFNNSIKYI